MVQFKHNQIFTFLAKIGSLSSLTIFHVGLKSVHKQRLLVCNVMQYLSCKLLFKILQTTHIYVVEIKKGIQIFVMIIQCSVWEANRVTTESLYISKDMLSVHWTTCSHKKSCIWKAPSNKTNLLLWLSVFFVVSMFGREEALIWLFWFCCYALWNMHAISNQYYFVFDHTELQNYSVIWNRITWEYSKIYNLIWHQIT